MNGHPHYNIVGAETGRCSSSKPNYFEIPRHAKNRRLLRKLRQAESNCTRAYNQKDLRRSNYWSHECAKLRRRIDPRPPARFVAIDPAPQMDESTRFIAYLTESLFHAIGIGPKGPHR